MRRTSTLLFLIALGSVSLAPRGYGQNQLLTVPVKGLPHTGCDSIPPNDSRFVLGILDVDDAGNVRDAKMLPSLVSCITDSRRRNRGNGVVVVVFVHGWRHSAHWDLATDSGDDNIESFRTVL